MNVLIYDHSVEPDADYQNRIRQLFIAIAETTVRFVSSILDATWHVRHFRPDVIIFDWISDCKPIRKLIAMLHGIKPDVAMFHLAGDSFIMTASLCGLPSGPAVPHWLHEMTSDWLLARCVPEQSLLS